MSAPVCRAMIAPNGIATRQVGRIDTLATNQSCWTNSRHCTGRRNAARTVSSDIAAKLPASRKTHLAGMVVMCSVGSQRSHGPTAAGAGGPSGLRDHARGQADRNLVRTLTREKPRLALTRPLEAL